MKNTCKALAVNKVERMKVIDLQEAVFSLFLPLRVVWQFREFI